jgi:5-formyltetrahydrofolate cyclo-ligase
MERVATASAGSDALPPTSSMSTDSIGQQKAALRRNARAGLASLSASERVRQSQRICDRLITHPRWLAARSVLLFAPLADEPNVWPLAGAALSAAKQVALPRYVASSGHYEAAQITNADDLAVGRFGVREPPADCPTLSLNRLDLVLVPGVAFDRGKGFYDRLLMELPGLKWGVAFDEQLVDALPCEPHDVPLNCILTPSHWLVRQPGATGE